MAAPGEDRNKLTHERADGPDIVKGRKPIDERKRRIETLQSKEDELEQLRKVDTEIATFAGAIPVVLAEIKRIDTALDQKTSSLLGLLNLKANKRPFDFQERRKKLQEEIDALEAERIQQAAKLEVSFSHSLTPEQWQFVVEKLKNGYAKLVKAAKSKSLNVFIQIVGEGADGSENRRVTGLKVEVRDRKYWKWNKVDVKAGGGAQAQSENAGADVGAATLGGTVALGSDLRVRIQPPPGKIDGDGNVTY